MNNINILQVSTYPIVKPLHGGQIRVFNLANKLREIGANVKSISFSEASHNHFDDSLDYVMDSISLSKKISTPFSSDLATSYVTLSDKKCEKFLVSHIDSFNTDYIFLEQPWVWPLVKKVIEDKNLNVKIVYSSQNVEYLTKISLFESNNISDLDDVIKNIEKIEKDLVLHSDYVIACTKSDGYILKEMGAKKIIVAPNGVSSFSINQGNLDKVKESIGDRKYALFVGSAYPPNAQGFWDVLGNNMAWLNSDEMILSVGGVSNILEAFMPAEAEINSFINFDRIKRLGFVSNEELTSLLELASVIILPITSGGGSNLKTAEAILSGKPVVATKMACRGFDEVTRYSNFSIKESGKEFINEIKLYLRSDYEKLSIEELSLRQEVRWDRVLSSLDEIFNI